MSFEVVGISVQHLTGVAFQMILQYHWLLGIDHYVMRLGIGDESLQLKRDISHFGDIQSGMILVYVHPPMIWQERMTAINAVGASRGDTNETQWMVNRVYPHFGQYY
jgi:hypothetical protein|eukprot:scaffold11592_cov359-Alexandrium_tamarense.AAC.1